jgi:DNA-binding NtrC family response regulator
MKDSTEAFEIFSVDPSRFDLVVTDQTMPRMNGLRLAKELHKIRPDIPIILLTGHSDAVTPDSLEEAGIKELLMKPLRKQRLAEVIRRCLMIGPKMCIVKSHTSN